MEDNEVNLQDLKISDSLLMNIDECNNVFSGNDIFFTQILEALVQLLEFFIKLLLSM